MAGRPTGWRHGIPYPHWTSSANYGVPGEPRFVFYPPLIWMLGAALGLVVPWSWVPATLTFLLLAATGIATLALARQLLPDRTAPRAACAALLSQYALFTACERRPFLNFQAASGFPAAAVCPQPTQPFRFLLAARAGRLGRAACAGRRRLLALEPPRWRDG